MKKLYNTPELIDEMLLAQDVMAASGDTDSEITESDTDTVVDVDNSFRAFSALR